MKLTISQEGANPITIRTNDGVRSEEKLGNLETSRIFTRGAQLAGGTVAGGIQGVQAGAALGAAIAAKKGTHIAAKTALGGVLGGVGGAALGAVAGASGVAGILVNTICNSIRSIGNFASGKEMLESPKLHDKLVSIKHKYSSYPTIAEVERCSKTKSKSGFLGWLLGGDVSGKTVKDNIRTSSMIVKTVDGIPVAVTKLTPILGSYDARQLVGQRVLVATAFVRKPSDDGIKSIPLCRGYLKRSAKGDVNPTRECADIYWSEDGKAHGKKEILKYVKAIRSGESSGPIDVNEAMNIIDELSV